MNVRVRAGQSATSSFIGAIVFFFFIGLCV
jgi:hypothetical protein